MQVVWILNGVPVRTDQVAAGGPPSTAEIGFTGQLPLGINTLAVTATDGSGNKSASARVNVTVAHDQGKNKGVKPDDQPGDDQGTNPGGQDDDGQDDDWSPGDDKGKGKDKDNGNGQGNGKKS